MYMHNSFLSSKFEPKLQSLTTETCSASGALPQDWVSECPDVKNYKWRLYPVWYRMLYSCTHVATVGVKGFTTLMTMMTNSWCGVRDWLLLLLLMMMMMI